MITVTSTDYILSIMDHLVMQSTCTVL